MRRRAPLAVFALVAAVGAPWAVSAPVGAGVVRSGIQVQVVDPGAKPRGILRLKPATTPISRTLTFSTEVTQSGVSSFHVGPLQLQTGISLTGSAAGPNGTIRVSYSYQGFKLLDGSVGTPQQLAGVRASLAQFQGFSGQYTLSSTGAVLSNRFVIPSTVNSTVRSLLQQLSDQSTQLSVPLPTEAVGVGARWTRSSQLVVGGIRLHQTYDYTLRSRDGNRLSLETRYTQTAPHQRIASPGLPSGTTITVTSYRVSGSGTTVVDLAQLTPVSGHLAARGLQVFRVQQGGQSGTINQQLQLGVDLATG